MGTLGCINDMLQRDKENRELRKLNKERMKEHHKYLVNKGKNINLSNISIETIEEIRKNTIRTVRPNLSIQGIYNFCNMPFRIIFIGHTLL